LAGAVPASYGAGVDFSAAIVAASGDHEHAKDLAEFLAAPQAVAARHANGLDIAEP